MTLPDGRTTSLRELDDTGFYSFSHFGPLYFVLPIVLPSPLPHFCERGQLTPDVKVSQVMVGLYCEVKDAKLGCVVVQDTVGTVVIVVSVSILTMFATFTTLSYTPQNISNSLHTTPHFDCTATNL